MEVPRGIMIQDLQARLINCRLRLDALGREMDDSPTKELKQERSRAFDCVVREGAEILRELEKLTFCPKT